MVVFHGMVSDDGLVSYTTLLALEVWVCVPAGVPKEDTPVTSTSTSVPIIL